MFIFHSVNFNNNFSSIEGIRRRPIARCTNRWEFSHRPKRTRSRLRKIQIQQLHSFGIAAANICVTSGNSWENCSESGGCDSRRYRLWQKYTGNWNSTKLISTKWITRKILFVFSELQLPQMILDDCRERKKRCNIIVTQPRRLAARSIAERVSRERMWELGSLVGYQIALDTRYTSEDTRILFCTTGLLLEKLIQAKSMSNYTHIILDEVHERDKNMDFLFIIIRMLLCTNSPDVKIILMSATIEAPKVSVEFFFFFRKFPDFSLFFAFFQFAEYFKLPVGDNLMPAPVIQIDQKTQFSVKNFYLEEISKYNTVSVLTAHKLLQWRHRSFLLNVISFFAQNLTVDFENPSICEEMYKIVLKLVILMKKIDENDHERLPYLPTILIFLPGINEINTLFDVLTDYMKPYVFATVVHFIGPES